MDTFGELPVGAMDTISRDPVDPIGIIQRSELLTDLAPGAVDALVGVAGAGSGSPLLIVEMRLLGGALARAPRGHGALAKLDGAFAVFAGGAAVDASAAAAIAARHEAVRDRLAPWTAPQALLNASGGGVDPARAFDAATWERLSAMRDRFDPERRLVSAHA
jgi:hypothetical protein